MRSLLGAVGAITLGVCGVAHATLITIDANDFAPGTNVSYANQGVTMSAMGYAYAYTDSSGRAMYAPILTGPVYSHALPQSVCSLEYGAMQPPCPIPATYNQVFTYAPGAGATWPSGYGRGWRTSPLTIAPCLGPCNQYAILDGDGNVLDSFLRLDFATPTRYVDMLGVEFAGDNNLMWAYDAAGNLVGDCSGGCITAGIDGSISDWLELSITSPTANISTVLISGANENADLIERVRYVPEPATLGLMCIGLAGMGLGWRKRKD